MAEAYTLALRLFQIGAMESPPSEANALTAQEAREAIITSCCEWAVCCRLDGKPASFERYYEAVYGVGLDGKALKVRKHAGR